MITRTLAGALVLIVLVAGCGPRHVTLEEAGFTPVGLRVSDGPLVDTASIEVQDARPSLPSDSSNPAMTIRYTGEPKDDRLWCWASPSVDLLRTALTNELERSGVARSTAHTPSPTARIVITILAFHGHYSSNNAEGANSLNASANALAVSGGGMATNRTDKQHRQEQYGVATFDVAVVVRGKQTLRKEVGAESRDWNLKAPENAAAALRQAVADVIREVDAGLR